MTPSTVAAAPDVLNPFAHPEVRAEWTDYQNRNARAATAYRARPFREIRREAERHLYRAAS